MNEQRIAEFQTIFSTPFDYDDDQDETFEDIDGNVDDRSPLQRAVDGIREIVQVADDLKVRDHVFDTTQVVVGKEGFLRFIDAVTEAEFLADEVEGEDRSDQLRIALKSHLALIRLVEEYASEVVGFMAGIAGPPNLYNSRIGQLTQDFFSVLPLDAFVTQQELDDLG